MGVLGEYITNIIYVAIFALIVELVLPKHSFKKYISGAMSLLVIISLVSPIFSFLKNDGLSEGIKEVVAAISFSDSTYKDNEVNINEYKNKVILSSVKENLENELTDKFTKRINGISNVEVELDDDYKLKNILVYISKNNMSEDRVKYILDTLLTEYDISTDLLVIKREKDTYE